MRLVNSLIGELIKEAIKVSKNFTEWNYGWVFPSEKVYGKTFLYKNNMYEIVKWRNNLITISNINKILYEIKL